MLHLNELKKKKEEEEAAAAMSKVRRKEKTKPWSRNTWNRDRNSTEKNDKSWAGLWKGQTRLTNTYLT